MKKLIYLFILPTFLLACSDEKVIENIYEGDVKLQSQADVDLFANEKYVGISGNLTIGLDSGPSDGAVTDLIELHTLTYVGGSLRISLNSALTSLDGLNNITAVGGALIVVQNESLESLAPLHKLQSIGIEEESEWSVRIGGLPSLEDLSGLESITILPGALLIQYNEALTSMDALSNLTGVDGDLIINSNALLPNLNGLDQVTSVGADLRIQFNDNLMNLDGLSKVTFVGANLIIEGNSNLSNLCGLSTLMQSGQIGSYDSTDNAFNPTQEELSSGTCKN